jgi:aldose 1-epimerase
MVGMVKLENGELAIWLDPSYGAATLALEWKGSPIMPDCRNQVRPPHGLLTKRSGLPEASFNMVPWSGRILDGILLERGRTYQLARAEEHAIHGEVWNQKWNILHQTETHLSLEQSRPHDSNFPWNYHVQYDVRVHKSVLSNKLTITNSSYENALLGGGFHPYFLRKGGAVVTLKASGQYPTGKMVGIPIGDPSFTPLCKQFNDAMKLERNQLIDDSFLLSDQKIEVCWPKDHFKMTMTLSESLTHFVVYNPNQDWFALEPVSHANNIFGSFGNKLRKPIPPRESLCLEYVLEIADFTTL